MAVQHLNIVDSQRHEPKGASTAGNNTVMHSDGDGTTTFKFVDYSNVENTPTIAAQDDSTAIDLATLVTDFNTLLANLRTSGLLNV